MSEKKYKLLKDWKCSEYWVKADTIKSFLEWSDMFPWLNDSGFDIDKSDWFELVKERDIFLNTSDGYANISIKGVSDSEVDFLTQQWWRIPRLINDILDENS